MLSRAFNHIHVDNLSNTIIKTSSNIPKLQDEINFYLNLPEKARSLFPKLIYYKKDYSAYSLEYIPLKNLAEIIVHNKISFEKGTNIIKKLFNILDEFHVFHPKYLSIKSIREFYIKKTIDRVAQLANKEHFKAMMQQNTLVINGKTYKNFHMLQSKFIRAIEKLPIDKTHLTLTHGDFCFSNILCNEEGTLIKLIDPRGSFGERGIFGHSYYDYAKILHCLHGNYDEIIHDYFFLKKINNYSFLFEITPSPLLQKLHACFQELVQQKGINVESLYLLEASLFLSMATLHYENIEHQTAFYLTGLKILNAYLEKTP